MKKAFIQLHIAVFLAGFTGILGRLIKLNEGMIVWYRLLLTAATMWILFGLMKKLKKISWVDIFKITGVGFIAAMHWVTFYGAIKYSNVSVALVCFSAIGFFTALFEPLILRKKLNWPELFLGLLTLSGIYIIFHFDAEYKTGIIIGIISAVLASLFPIFNREFLKRINVETMLTWQQTGGLLTLSLLLPFYLNKFPTENFMPGWENLGWLLVLSWFCSVVAFQLSGNALKKAKNNKYVLLNAPDDKLKEICGLLPGMKSPTVLPLAEPGWSSVHSVINENDFWNVIEKLKIAGAQGILIIPIEKMII